MSYYSFFSFILLHFHCHSFIKLYPLNNVWWFIFNFFYFIVLCVPLVELGPCTTWKSYLVVGCRHLKQSFLKTVPLFSFESRSYLLNAYNSIKLSSNCLICRGSESDVGRCNRVQVYIIVWQGLNTNRWSFLREEWTVCSVASCVLGWSRGWGLLIRAVYFPCLFFFKFSIQLSQCFHFVIRWLD